MTPRVTVLLAVRDGLPYLQATLDSVLAQTYGDFELLVVDDASTDGSRELVRGLADPRVRLLENESNLGQVPSLNRGLQEARGEIVARVDHDDVCAPTRLELQVGVLDREPQVALVGSWAALVDERDAVVGTVRQSIRDYVDFLYWNLVGWVLIPHSAASFRREDALAVGGYDETLGPSEDKDLWRKLVLRRREARIVEEELVRYRLHARQLSRVQEERQRRHDAASHEAFLRALLPPEGVDVTRLRLLLTADPRYFDGGAGGRSSVPDLQALLAGAAATLSLSESERARLERLLRARVAKAARAGWQGDVRVWWRTSAPLAAYGAGRGGRGAAADALVYALELPAAPALALGARTLRRVAATALASRRLRLLEERARRSRLARRVYAWLVGRS